MKSLPVIKRVMPKPVFYPLGALFGAEEYPISHIYNDADYETIEFDVMIDDDCQSMFSVFSIDD